MLSNHDLDAFIEQLRSELADVNESIAALEQYQEKLRSKAQGRADEKTGAKPRGSDRPAGSSAE
jgi:prefoldin subunit 5